MFGFGKKNKEANAEDVSVNELTKSIAARFDCEYTVYAKGSDAESLEKEYMKLISDCKGKGYIPAILVCDEYVDEWLEIIEEDNLVREELISGCGDGKKILNERYDEYTETSEDYTEEELKELIGEGQEHEGEVISHFTGYLGYDENMKGKLEYDCLLLKIPVENPWEIIAWIPMGGWNDCPAPEDMIAVCKYWYEAYGALPALFTHDVLEFYVPDNIDASGKMDIAKEHYAFCADRVDQCTGSGTISEVAAGIPGSKIWYFWWD
ncbi:MAG: DUF4253 domain-containing protein [Lachnospiraceae bacterium]|nr:DUF4253 domain-containing protein [Lachnospiraceae bacterium]